MVIAVVASTLEFVALRDFNAPGILYACHFLILFLILYSEATRRRQQ
mgnify:CR=1 FL=1